MVKGVAMLNLDKPAAPAQAREQIDLTETSALKKLHVTQIRCQKVGFLP